MRASSAAHRAPRCLIALVLVSSPLASGCSVFFVHGPTEVAPGRYTPCTSNPLAPVVDTFIASFQVGRTFIALSSDADDYSNVPIPREADIAVGAALAATFIGSAFYGYTSVRRCREIRGPVVSPGPRTPARPTRVDRLADEAAEEAAVQARIKAKTAADAKAAAEAAGAAPEQKDDADAP